MKRLDCTNIHIIYGTCLCFYKKNAILRTHSSMYDNMKRQEILYRKEEKHQVSPSARSTFFIIFLKWLGDILTVRVFIKDRDSYKGTGLWIRKKKKTIFSLKQTGNL